MNLEECKREFNEWYDIEGIEDGIPAAYAWACAYGKRLIEEVEAGTIDYTSRTLAKDNIDLREEVKSLKAELKIQENFWRIQVAKALLRKIE